MSEKQIDEKEATEEKDSKTAEKEDHQDQRIEKIGQITLNENKEKHNIHLLSIIGEVEGHDNLSGNAKTTKYEHILPQLAAIEDSSEIQGVLVLLNTMGGDVEAGLAIAEMLASLSKPTVSLVLGKSFYWGAYCSQHGLFIYCAYRNNGNSSGENEWYGYRCASDL